MKRLLLLSFLMMLAFSVKAQTGKKELKDTLIWKNDSMLVSSDFTGKPKGKTYYGFASSGIVLYSKEKDGMMLMVIEAIFQKSKSYMKGNSPYLLKHEQLHFDITELYARKLRQRIAQKDFSKVKKIHEEILKMYNKVNAELSREQEKYDAATEHSQNAAKQKRWNESIRNQLKTLENFSNTEINIAK